MASLKSMDGALSQNTSVDELGVPTVHLAEVLAEEPIPGQSKRGKTLEQVLRHERERENIAKIVLPVEEFRNLRNEKLNDLSDRFRMTMVNLCMTAKDGDSVRLCLSNLMFWTEDFASWLDSFSGAEVEPLDERDFQRRRDGVYHSRGNARSEDHTERKGEEGGVGVGSGEEHGPASSGEERDGGSQGSPKGEDAVGESGNRIHYLETEGPVGGNGTPRGSTD